MLQIYYKSISLSIIYLVYTIFHWTEVLIITIKFVSLTVNSLGFVCSLEMTSLHKVYKSILLYPFPNIVALSPVKAYGVYFAISCKGLISFFHVLSQLSQCYLINLFSSFLKCYPYCKLLSNNGLFSFSLLSFLNFLVYY